MELLSDDWVCDIILLWPAVVEDIEGYVHIIWDTNGVEVTLEFIHKENGINIEKDYYKLNTSATYLEDIPKNDTITLKVKTIIL